MRTTHVVESSVWTLKSALVASCRPWASLKASLNFWHWRRKNGVDILSAADPDQDISLSKKRGWSKSHASSDHCSLCFFSYNTLLKSGFWKFRCKKSEIQHQGQSWNQARNKMEGHKERHKMILANQWSCILFHYLLSPMRWFKPISAPVYDWHTYSWHSLPSKNLQSSWSSGEEDFLESSGEKMERPRLWLAGGWLPCSRLARQPAWMLPWPLPHHANCFYQCCHRDLLLHGSV